MIKESLKSKTGIWVASALFFVTVFVTPYWNYDPINIPKFWALITFAFAILGLLFTKFKVLINFKEWQIWGPPTLLILFMTLTLFLVNAPFTQQLFGTFGRNTGYLTYLSFFIIFLATAFATNINIVKPFIIAIVSALSVNAVYGFIQAIGKDPQSWVNPYAPVIGTLGNPDFASAFLGMGAGFLLAYILAPKTKFGYRLLGALLVILALLDIIKSNAQQGLLVLLLSLVVILFFTINSKFKNRNINFLYLALTSIASLLVVAGSLQKGPLANLLYKASVTYRGDYWHAGIKMMFKNPLLGVGLDSYGDWYRTFRSQAATLRRGPSVISNAAHNVFLDVGATAGILALLMYLLFILVGIRAAWRIHKKSTKYEPFFVGVLIVWLAYLAQSTISINNIALGIWGWVLPGILISMERWPSLSAENIGLNIKNRKKQSSVTDFSGMSAVIGLVVGCTIGFFPFNADANFVYSLKSHSPDLILNSINKWPQDQVRSFYTVNLFSQNNLADKAEVIARKTVEVNPRFFDGLMYLYQLPGTSGNEKREILDRLKLIDPHNPDLKKLG